MFKRGLLRERWDWIALAILVIAIFLIRFYFLNLNYAPTGCDPANYLTVLHALYGYNVSGFQIQMFYPPLYFYLILKPLSYLFGELSALKISASLLSSIIALPFFVLVKKITGSGLIALFTSGLFAFAERFSSMILWGGHQNFLALFFMLFSIYFFYEMVDRESRKHAVLAGVFLSLTVGSHHLVAPYYLIGLIIALVGIVVIKRNFRSLLKNLSIFLVTGVLLSLPYFQIYFGFMSAYVSSFYFNNNATSVFDLNVYLNGFNLFFGTYLNEWIIVVILGIFGILLEFTHTKTATMLILGLTTSSFICGLLLFLLFQGDTFLRSLYFLYVPIFLALGIFLYAVKRRMFENHVGKTRNRRIIVGTIAFAVLIIISLNFVGTSLNYLNQGSSLYNIADSNVIMGLEWLKYNTPPNSIVVTNDDKHSWWVEGYGLRNSFTDLPRQFYGSITQNLESVVADKILAGNYLLENGYIRVSDSYPADYHNPLLSVNLGGNYQNLLSFDDNYAGIIVVPSNETDSTVHFSLYSINKSTNINVDRNMGKGLISYNYYNNYAKVNRTTEITRLPQTRLTYNVAVTNSTLERFQFCMFIWSGSKVQPWLELETRICFILDDKILLTVADGFNRIFSLVISVNTDCESSEITYSNSRQGFFFDFNTTKPTFYVDLVINVEPKVYTLFNNVQFFNSLELIENLGIDYLFMIKEMPWDVNRFIHFKDLFVPVFENSKILILKVV